MNWDDLRYFLALCREGSVSRAGKALGVEHTTVARRIAALEEVLKTRLFDRTRNGYAMTQAAENMYIDAAQIEARVHTIDREAFGRDAQLKGKLKLTVPYDFANQIIVQKLHVFRKTYPQIELEVLTTLGLLDLAAREADIAVRLTPKPPDYLVGKQILPLSHGVYASKAYLRNWPKVVEFVAFRGNESPEWVSKNFPGAKTSVCTDSVSTIHAAVVAGLGLARLPCFVGDSNAKLRRLDVELAPSNWGVWILTHVDLRSTARVRTCRNFLTNVISGQSALILGETSRYA